MKPNQQKLKVGRVDNKRVDQYNLPIREREPLLFALADLPAKVARLIVGGYLIAQCVPVYDDVQYDGKTIARLNLFGENVPFHRYLISPDVECILQIECEREKDFTTQPSMRIGFGQTEKLNPTERVEVPVKLNNVDKTLVYTWQGCEFACS
jgi:hypothetical protein